MSLTGTLFTGLSGLVVNQSDLNVVGNNIANANTTAFKSSSVQFSPQFYVTQDAGSPATGTFGGSNPSQEGLGAQVASITQNFSPGALQATGVPSDLAINGNGFFVVQNQAAGQQYTRDGAFTLNSYNQLVDQSGNFVQGYGVDSNFKLIPGTLTNVTIPLGQDTIAQATQNATISGNLNAGGTPATNASILTTTQALQDAGTAGPTVTNSTLLTNLETFGGTTPLYTLGETITAAGTQGGRSLAAQTLTVKATTTVADLETFLTQALAIDPNPPAGTPGPTPGGSIVNATGGGQQLVITGNVGTQNAVSLSGTALTTSAGASPLTFTDDGGANGESTFTPITVYDSLGNPVALNVNTTLISQSTTGTTWEFNVTSPDNQGGNPVLGSGTLNFNTSGQLASVTGNTVTIDRSGTGATASQAITLNFGAVQSLSGADSDLVNPSQDGFPIGTLNGYSVGADGTITGTFTNGLTKTIGQVALANFANPQGLTDDGGNVYSAGASSGEPIIGTAGSQGTGTIQAGELELSNVDLSQEFINLIIASTGYSASSRVISTSDQLLTDLLNSQR